jgi:hypothetical protein
MNKPKAINNKLDLSTSKAVFIGYCLPLLSSKPSELV